MLCLLLAGRATALSPSAGGRVSATGVLAATRGSEMCSASVAADLGLIFSLESNLHQTHPLGVAPGLRVAVNWGGSGEVLEGCWYHNHKALQLFQGFGFGVVFFGWFAGLCLFSSLSVFFSASSKKKNPQRLEFPKVKGRGASSAAVALGRRGARCPDITATTGGCVRPPSLEQGKSTRMLKDRRGCHRAAGTV